MNRSAHDSAQLTVRLFGAFEASARGVDLKRPVRKDTLRLWQLLLVQRDQTRSREAIATTLWPDATAQKARFNLRYHVHHLHNHLPTLPEPQHWVVSDRNRLRWDSNAPTWLDVGAFDGFIGAGLRNVDRAPTEAATQLDAALALYRADLLLDVLDDWTVGPREQLRTGAVDGLEALIGIRERLGQLGDALANARRLLDIDPHREATYRHVMRLNGRLGDRTTALEAFAACCGMLESAYGVNPSVETLELQAWLVSGADSERLPRLAGTRSSSPPATNIPSVVTVIRSDTTASAPLSQLPFLVGRFVGRRREVGEIAQAVQRSRLVTLIGAGGVGKTSLALEVARATRAHFCDDVAWVALDNVQNPALIETHVARVVMTQPPDDAEPHAALSQFYGSRHALLVCDNCEHVLAEVADFVAALLHACPNLSVLATSRAPLQIEGEQRWSIRPLTLPPTTGPMPVAVDDLVAVSDAAALFIDRARSVQSDYLPLPPAVSAIADICARVDGIPLAIELAAAQINLMTAEEIAERLTKDFKVLATMVTNGAPRHSTLDACIAWSYGLLGHEERRFLSLLTVFPRSFDLRAVTHVCGNDMSTEAAHHRLLALIDSSMVQIEASAQRRRFRWLDPIRSYVIERTIEDRQGGESGPATVGRSMVTAGVDRGMDAALAHRHAAYFLAEAERSEALLAQEGRPAAEISRLSYDESNFLAAQATFVGSGDVESARRLAGALWRFWYKQGFTRQLRDAMWVLIDTSAPRPITLGYAKVLLAIGATSYRIGEHVAAQRAFAESVTVFERLGLTAELGLSLVQLSAAYLANGNLELARAQLDRAMEMSRASGDEASLTGQLNTLAHLYWRQGRYDDAWKTASELLDRATALGEPNVLVVQAHYALALTSMSWADYPLAELHLTVAREAAIAIGRDDSVAAQDSLIGIVYTLQGKYLEAYQKLRTSLDADRGTGNEMRTARDMHNLGELALARGEFPVARALLGRSLEIKTRLNETVGRIYNLLSCATLAHETEDLIGAKNLVDEVAALVEPSGEASLLAWYQSVGARLALAAEDFEEAAKLLAASLDFCVPSGEQRRLAINLERAALLALALGRGDDARALAAAAADLRAQIGAPRTFGEARDIAGAGLAESDPGAAAKNAPTAATPSLEGAIALAHAVLADASA